MDMIVYLHLHQKIRDLNYKKYYFSSKSIFFWKIEKMEKLKFLKLLKIKPSGKIMNLQLEFSVNILTIYENSKKMRYLDVH